MCIIFTEEFHFSLPPAPCVTCTRLQFITCDFQNFCPSCLKPPPFNYPKRKRLRGEEENFLKCLIFLHVRGMVNLRNRLSVSPDDSMQLRNKLETVSIREKGGEEQTCVYVSSFFPFSFSFPFFLLFEVSRHYFRLAVRKWGRVAQPPPLNRKAPRGRAAQLTQCEFVRCALTCQWGCQKTAS